MSRTINTIEKQTSYDLCIQMFGGLDDIDELLRANADINASFPTGEEVTLEDTDDELAKRFEVNNVLIATGVDFVDEEEEDVGGFEYELEFQFEG